MKKTTPLIFILSLLFSSLSTFAQERIIPENELPQNIRTYISTHFKESKYINIEAEKEGSSVTHEVKLDNNIELEFDSKYQVKEIKSNSDTKLPDSVIPASILSYVQSGYPGNGIVEWELKRNKQEIELDNGTEMEFDLSGKFLRIDD